MKTYNLVDPDTKRTIASVTYEPSEYEDDTQIFTAEEIMNKLTPVMKQLPYKRVWITGGLSNDLMRKGNPIEFAVETEEDTLCYMIDVMTIFWEVLGRFVIVNPAASIPRFTENYRVQIYGPCEIEDGDLHG